MLLKYPVKYFGRLLLLTFVFGGRVCPAVWYVENLTKDINLDLPFLLGGGDIR